MRFGVRFDTKQQTGGSGEEPPVSSILESNSAKLRAKNSVLQSKMNNLCQISRQIFRRSFSRNSARYKTFMFLCQAPRLCQIDRLPCRERTQAARTFMRVLPLPVPAMLKTRAPLVGYASRASASASAAVFCHAKRLSGSAGRKTASSEQGCRPVRDASGRSTRFAMRQTRSAAFSETRDK